MQRNAEQRWLCYEDPGVDIKAEVSSSLRLVLSYHMRSGEYRGSEATYAKHINTQSSFLSYKSTWKDLLLVSIRQTPAQLAIWSQFDGTTGHKLQCCWECSVFGLPNLSDKVSTVSSSSTGTASWSTEAQGSTVYQRPTWETQKSDTYSNKMNSASRDPHASSQYQLIGVGSFK